MVLHKFYCKSRVYIAYFYHIKIRREGSISIIKGLLITQY